MKKYLILIIISLVFLFTLFIYQNYKFYDGKLHLIFCNVGQGDGILIRTPKGTNILLDGGPDDSILNCLSSHTPFWDRTISLMILSHPHADHLNGLVEVLKRYTVLSFVTEKLENKTLGVEELHSQIMNKHIVPHYVVAGNAIHVGEANFNFLGPTQEFLDQTSPGGLIGETSEFGSLETLIKYGSFTAFLTADSQVEEMEHALNSISSAVNVLQVPHHGSRFGLNQEILEALSPKLAVISVGKNKYGHPTPFTLGLLKDLNIETLRTDQIGDIEIISDGKSWKFL